MRAWVLALLIGSAGAETLQVEADDGEAQTLLATHLDLARALAQRERLPFDELERERLCALTPDQTRELLGTLGRFQPGRIELDCGAARLKVEVGPQALVRRVDFQASGASETQLAEWREILALREGDAFTQARWSEAKRALLVRLRAAGQPLARWDSTQAQVDVEAKAVDLRLSLDPGVTVRIARVDISGLKHHNEARVRELMGLQPGRRVRETALVTAQERLLKSGLFDAVQIELDMDALQGDRAPIKVLLREAPLQQLGLGLGWSSNSGERVTLEHQHRLPLGWPVRTSSKLAWAKDTQSVDLEVSAHPGAQQRRNLAALRWEREASTDAPYRQASIRLGQVYETRRHDRSLLVEALSSRQGLGALSTRSEALLLRWDPTWRELDSVLLPTRGQALLLQTALGPARSRGLLGDTQKGTLGRLHARWQVWQPLAQGRGLQLRLEAGQVFAPRELVLPESLRWRAGGDESVRGYSYRSLGPRRNNQEVGGRVVWTASFEASQPLPKSWVGGLDGLAVAAFVDAGQAADSWKEASPAWGFGAGVRWRSPVGLLRADIAKGEKSQGGGWRLHIAVGLAL
jgi:translocation and assembly module TamA